MSTTIGEHVKARAVAMVDALTGRHREVKMSRRRTIVQPTAVTHVQMIENGRPVPQLGAIDFAHPNRGEGVSAEELERINNYRPKRRRR